MASGRLLVRRNVNRRLRCDCVAGQGKIDGPRRNWSGTGKNGRFRRRVDKDRRHSDRFQAARLPECGRSQSHAVRGGARKSFATLFATHPPLPVVTTFLATLAVASGGDQEAGRRAFHGALQRLYGDAATADNPRRLSWQQTLDGGWAAMDALEPKAKQALVEAMVVAVLDDGTVTAPEVELLRAACGLMHVPLPALLA